MPQYTFYAPGPGDRMEGGFETSRKNKEGEYIPRTLDDFRLGKSDYVTLASDPSRYGESVDLGDVKYKSPIDQREYTLSGVRGLIHDTGSAFKGRPDKLDIATGDFRGWSPAAASNFVARNSVGGTSAAPMAYADQQEDPRFDPARMLLSAIGGPQARPDVGAADRFGAGLQSFLGGGNLPGAIGGLLSGIATGQRQDPGYIAQQYRDRALAETARQHSITEARGNRTNDLAEQRMNRPQLYWEKDPDTEEMVPHLYNPVDQSVRRISPKLAGEPPPQTSDAGDSILPATASPVQYITPGAPGMPAAPPVGLNPKQMRIYNETRARAQATQDVKKGQTAKGDSEQNKIVVEDLDRAIKFAEENPWTSTGLIGGSTKDIPGSPGHNLSELVSSAESGISLERLQKLRQESPTGGALGNVSDKDMNILKTAMGSLKNSQSKEQFVFNARRVQRIYNDIIHGPGANATPPPGRPSKGDIQKELIRRGVLNADSL